MADTRFRITTPLFFILANFAFGDVTSEIIVQSNGNFTLQPNVQSPPEDILWRWNENKVVEFYQKEMVDYGQFKGRTTLDFSTGALTLTHLTEADSGEYVGELQIKGELVEYHQTVKVFDAVGKPAVTCQVNGSSVALLCSGGDRPSTQYRWEGPAIEPQPGSQLKIEAAESSDAIYTCVLHNPVGESRTDFPVKSCFPAPGSASVVISVVLVLLLIFIIVGLLLFYYKKCYKKLTRLGERDSEAAVNERQQLLSADPENVEETPVSVQESAELGKDMLNPGKTHDEDQKTALTEQHKGTDESAGISQEESQTESLNQTEDSEERGVETEGGNSPPAALPETENEKEKTNPPDPAQELLSSLEEVEDILESQTVIVWDRVKLIESGWSPGKTHDEHQKTALTEQHKGTDESAGISQESQTESLNQAEDSEERGVEAEGGNSKHPSSGTVPFCAPESPSAAPPKTENEEDVFETPPSSPSLTRHFESGGSDGGGAQPSGAGGGGDQSVPKPDSDQDINSRSAEENLSVQSTEPLSTADPAQGLPDTTAPSPPHTGASEESCCAEESPTSGPNMEPNSTSEAEEEKKIGREERKDSQDRGVKSPPEKPPRTYIP